MKALLTEGETLDAGQILGRTDGLIEAFREVVHIHPRKEESEEILANHTEQIGQLLRDSQDRLAKQSEEIEALRLKISEAEKNATATATRADTLEERMDKAVTNVTDSATSAVAEIREQATAAESRRKAEWSQVVESTKSNAKQEVATLEAEIRKQLGDFEDRANAQIASIETKRKEAAKVVTLITNSGLTGHYHNEANNAQKAGRVFTIFSLVLLTVPLLVGLLTYFSFDESTKWTELAVRLGIGVAALIPAGFTVKEAARLKRLEMASRQRELEFATIPSFLDDLPDEKQEAVREKLVEAYFGQPLVPDISPPPGKDDEIVTSGQLLQTLERVIKITSK
ncbi:MAG: hypothetical protein AAF663_06090 [Planctomycetota bacterium]